MINKYETFLEEILRFEKANHSVQRVIVVENCAQQALLSFDVVRERQCFRPLHFVVMKRQIHGLSPDDG